MFDFCRRSLLFALGAMTLLGRTAGFGATPLAVGDEAPDFSLPATDGSEMSLASYRGRSNVVLAFFPKAFTGG